VPLAPAEEPGGAWSQQGRAIADEISHEDLPSAHLPGLPTASGSERPKPTSTPPASTERQGGSGRGWILIAALLAIACVLALWWLSPSPVGDESAEPESVAVPIEPEGNPPAAESPGDEEIADTTTPAAETTAATAGATDEVAEPTPASTAPSAPPPAATARPTPPQSGSRPPSKPKPSSTKDKPELVEH
jgi:hypothetical protein